MIFEKTKKLFKKRKYQVVFLISFFAYVTLSLLLIKFFYTSYEAFLSQGLLSKIEFSLMLVIAFLFSVNMMFVFYTFSNIKTYANQTGTGFFSAVVGLLFAGCPACTFGILALAIPYFGAIISIPVFPLRGIELQLIGISVLILGIFLLSRDLSCE